MKRMTLVALMAATMTCAACGKVATSSSGGGGAKNGTNNTGGGGGGGVTQPDPNNCTTVTHVDNEAQALQDIASLSRAECQDRFQRLSGFYQDTQGMTEQQRQAYFQQLTAGMNPPPPPPPPICSTIYVAIRDCASGN